LDLEDNRIALLDIAVIVPHGAGRTAWRARYRGRARCLARRSITLLK